MHSRREYRMSLVKRVVEVYVFCMIIKNIAKGLIKSQTVSASSSIVPTLTD